MVDRPADDPQKLSDANSTLTSEEAAELNVLDLKSRSGPPFLSRDEGARYMELKMIERGNLTREEAQEDSVLRNERMSGRTPEEEVRLSELIFIHATGERGLAILYGQIRGKKLAKQAMTPEENHALFRLNHMMHDEAFAHGHIDHNRAAGLLRRLMQGKDAAHLSEVALREEFIKNYLGDSPIVPIVGPSLSAPRDMAALYARLMHKYITTGELIGVERLALEDLAFTCLHVDPWESLYDLDLGSAFDATRSRTARIVPPSPPIATN